MRIVVVLSTDKSQSQVREIVQSSSLVTCIKPRHHKPELDEDLEEVLSKMIQTVWSEAAQTRRFWAGRGRRATTFMGLGSSHRWKHFVPRDWMGLRKGDEGAAGCLYANLRDGQQQHEEILSDLGDQVWKELPDDWQRHLLEKEESPTF